MSKRSCDENNTLPPSQRQCQPIITSSVRAITTGRELLDTFESLAKSSDSYMHCLPTLGPLQMTREYTKYALRRHGIGTLNMSPANHYEIVGVFPKRHVDHRVVGMAALPMENLVAVASLYDTGIDLFRSDDLTFVRSIQMSEKISYKDPWFTLTYSDCNDSLVVYEWNRGDLFVLPLPYTDENEHRFKSLTLPSRSSYIDLCSIVAISNNRLVFTDAHSNTVCIHSFDNSPAVQEIQLPEHCGPRVVSTHDGNFAVIETNGNTIHCFRADGTPTRKISLGSNRFHFGNVKCADTDSEGNFVIGSVFNHTPACVIQSDGAFIRYFGRIGNGPCFSCMSSTGVVVVNCVCVTPTGGMITSGTYVGRALLSLWQ
jgi:hypothetical protein